MATAPVCSAPRCAVHMEAELNPQQQAAAEWAAAKKAWGDIEAELDAQSPIGEAAGPASGEIKQRGASQARSRKRKRESGPSKGRLIPIDVRNGLDSATETEITQQYQKNGLVMIKVLDQVGCFPQLSPLAGLRKRARACTLSCSVIRVGVTHEWVLDHFLAHQSACPDFVFTTTPYSLRATISLWNNGKR